MDQYEATIGCLQAIVNGYVGCSVVLGRDWNVAKDGNYPAEPFVSQFCRDNMCWLDQSDDSVTFSYYCDANNHLSLVDRFICSSYLVDKMQILADGHNTSDHFAVSLEVKILSCSSNPQPKR